MPRRARCSLRRCERLGYGDPPLCDVHMQKLYPQEEKSDTDGVGVGGVAPDDPLAAALGVLLNHPRANEVLGKVSGGIDRLGDFLDRAAGRAQTAAQAARAGAPPPRAPFPGFRPPPQVPRPRPAFDARAVFGFPPGMKLTPEVVKKRYRELAVKHHPDHTGGSTQKMAEVNRARDALEKEMGT